jgi:hypothetical protein
LARHIPDDGQRSDLETLAQFRADELAEGKQ